MRAKKTTEMTTVLGKQILLSLLVISLTLVIAAQVGLAAPEQISAQASAAAAAVDPKDPTKNSPEAELSPKEAIKEVGSGKPISVAVPEKSSSIAAEAVKSSSPDQSDLSAKSSSSATIVEQSNKQSKETVVDQSSKADSEASKRKARAEPTSAASSATSTASAAAPADESAKAGESAKQASEKAKLEPKTSAQKAKSQPSKSVPKSKLPANLGTVTSTGSGGHYMSKHDAYSAIAEKHGALAHDVMKKSDKRQFQSFGGIQKASGGLGDVLNPFKTVSDSGLARTLGASMRSIMKGKYSVPAYVASALLGAVALMAFYESPISPLPVPPLPEPPTGRFPPEMPNLPVGTQVPFRINMQQQQYGQNYNQRSLNTMPQAQGYSNQQAQAQQVLFPGSNSNQVAQQRQLSSSSNPVGQLATSLLSGKQVAQRKSGLDYDPSSSRSLFGSSPATKLSNPPNQKQQNSFLSFFGFGSDSTGHSNEQGHHHQSGSNSIVQASSSNSPMVAASSVETSGASGSLSNSHLVNKVKSLFNRSPAPSSSSSGSSISHNANINPYEQYQRMSFVQALMKDTAFLPGFLSPTRKSSNSGNSNGGSSHSSASNKFHHSGAIPASGSNPSARMQVGNDGTLSSSSSHLAPAVKTASANKPAGNGFGLAKAADRIAHALLETFSSGISQRNAPTTANAFNNQPSDGAARKGSIDESGQSSLASATSLLSDIMSTYNAVSEQQQSQPPQEQGKSAAATSSSSSSQAQQQASQQNSQGIQTEQSQQISARSDTPASITTDDEHKQQQQQQSPKSSASSQTSSSSSSSAPSGEIHSRKTRSIGFEYPLETNTELIRRENQPSKATQINNVIDFVADSYAQNRLLFNFVMNQVGLSQAVPYVEQILSGENH